MFKDKYIGTFSFVDKALDKLEEIMLGASSISSTVDVDPSDWEGKDTVNESKFICDDEMYM